MSHDGTVLLWRHRLEQREIQATSSDESSDDESAHADSGNESSEEDEDGDSVMQSQDEEHADDEEANSISESADEEESMDVDAATVESYDRWSLTQEDKHFFMQDHAKVTCCDMHPASGILVVGFTSGVFALYEMPDFNAISTLRLVLVAALALTLTSISQNRLSAVTINSTGEWIALASSKLGQLVVWEWQSETYILKQQGHFYDMNVLAYSPDGQLIATGGDDSKARMLNMFQANALQVKLWNVSSGFCFVTFSEHKGGVTAILFTPNGKVVLSASLDGSIRAFDLKRYRNFRTFTSTHPVQVQLTSRTTRLTCCSLLPLPSTQAGKLYVLALWTTLRSICGPCSRAAFWRCSQGTR